MADRIFVEGCKCEGKACEFVWPLLTDCRRKQIQNGVGSQFAEEKSILIFFVGANPSLEGQSRLLFLFVNEYAISSASIGNRLRFFGNGFLFM